MKSLAEIELERAARGISKSELCRVAGIDNHTYGRALKNHNSPNSRTLESLGRALEAITFAPANFPISRSNPTKRTLPMNIVSQAVEAIARGELVIVTDDGGVAVHAGKNGFHHPQLLRNCLHPAHLG